MSAEMLEQFINFGLEASAWLQSSYPQLLEAMRLVSDFGRIEAALLLIPLIYWCINKRFGSELMWLLLISGFINQFGKHSLRQPRPFWFDENLLQSDTGSGYGFPSGHVQSITVLLLAFTVRFKEAWLVLLTLAGIFVMGLSRVYLGVHFVHDVLGGLLLGVMVLIGAELWKHFLARRYADRIFGQRLLVVVCLPFALLILWGLVIAWRGSPVLTEVAVWDELLLSAETSSYHSMIRTLALLLGVGAGLAFEASRVRFVATGEVWKRAARLIVGMGLLYGVWFGMEQLIGIIAPDELLWLVGPLWFLQYLLIGLVLTYYAPILFVSFGLANVSDEPENSYSIKASALPQRRE